MPINNKLAEEFFGQKDQARREPAGEINGKLVYAGEFSALEAFEIDCETAKANAESGGKFDLLRPARRIVRSIMDENNNVVFDRDEATLKRLLAMPVHFIEPLSRAVDKANRTGIGETEELKKNSETQESPSLSVSPETTAA